MEAKSDAETQLRSRKLPLTRKIYAFYRAPIVKFWSNTVGRLQSRAQARAHGRGQPGAVHVYQRRAPGNRLWLLAAGGARAEVDGKEHCGAVTFTSMSSIIRRELLPSLFLLSSPRRVLRVLAHTFTCRNSTVFQVRQGCEQLISSVQLFACLSRLRPAYLHLQRLFPAPDFTTLVQHSMTQDASANGRLSSS